MQRAMQRPPLTAPRTMADAALAVRETRDEAAVLDAWRRLGPLVNRTLSRMLGGDDEVVQDLSQEAFLQLYQSAPALRSPKAIRPFVDGIAVHLALHELRRRRVRQGQLLVPGQGPLPPRTFDADPEAREAVAALLDLIGRLRPADRQLFVLWQVEGLDQTEISAATGLSISTIRRRLRRIRRRITSLVRTEPALAAYAERAGDRPATA